MGRPKVDDEKRRTINFTIRLTGSEQQRLEEAAEITGKTPAVLIRQKIFKGKFPKAKTARIELDTYFQLRKIGVNLNQLTRLANSGIFSNTLLKILDRLKKQQEMIIEQILNYDSQSEDR